MDAWAAAQAGGGVRATAVQWGAWLSVGMVHSKHSISRQQAAALGMLSTEAGLAAMQAVLAARRALTAPVVGAAMQSYWRSLLAGAPAVPPLYDALDIRPGTPAAPVEVATPASLQRQQPHQQPAALDVAAVVRQTVVGVLGSGALDDHKPLALQGLDSLAGAQLRPRCRPCAAALPLVQRADTMLHHAWACVLPLCPAALPCRPRTAAEAAGRAGH